MRVAVLSSLDEVAPEAWDALAGDDDPFVEHAFLSALERSGAVGAEAGWVPMHVTVWDDSELVGALPLYLKDHSYGEFIFDWAWADASSRLGAPYYPKLVSMVPLTPATGRRLLVREDDPRRADIVRTLRAGCLELAERTRASSVHILFTTDGEAAALAEDGPLFRRLSSQFHWHNRGYADFDAFLAEFRANVRKQTRRERSAVAASGLRIETKTGAELDERAWEALHRFYVNTCWRKGSPEYLPPEFFTELRARAAARVVAVLAYRGDEIVAGTLNFEKGKHIYGRYWGATEDVEYLHFELCYYRLIERAIEKGMDRFEAGAQGHHKLRRGLMPSEIHSVHWVRHPVLSRAVEEHVLREAGAVRHEMRELARHGPFRREMP
ncbi:MAG: GNAT family N-acetyltransferase [Polyangiales bacterium]